MNFETNDILTEVAVKSESEQENNEIQERIRVNDACVNDKQSLCDEGRLRVGDLVSNPIAEWCCCEEEREKEFRKFALVGKLYT